MMENTPEKSHVVRENDVPSATPTESHSSPSSVNVVSPTSSSSQQILTSPRARRTRSRTSRLEKIVFIFVSVFVLNSLNGRLIMKSIRTQMEQFYSDTTPEELPKVENKTEDTAIIITSSSIPSHPSTYMIDTVVESIDRLIGLSETAPIFITIDHIRYTDFDGLPPALKERIDKLEEYTVNLFNQHLTNPRIHIIPGMKMWHIGGSVLKAMNLIEKHYPEVQYLYYLQHDFFFARDVDHTALVNMFEVHDKVNWVRFAKRSAVTLHPGCAGEPNIELNRTFPISRGGTRIGEELSNNTDTSIGEGLDDNSEISESADYGKITIMPTTSYSDNNHMARFKWYKWLIESIIKVDRAPENPLQVRANDGCRLGKPLGLYIYGESNVIGHLDGRLTKDVPKR